MPISDETLYAISRLSVGTPVTDETIFTAMTPAQVAAKYELSSYGGDEGSYVYALGSDGDYDALDPDLPPVTDLGLWAVGAFVNQVENSNYAGAVAGTPGTLPTGLTAYATTVTEVVTGTYKGLPYVGIKGTINSGNSSFWPDSRGVNAAVGQRIAIDGWGKAVVVGAGGTGLSLRSNSTPLVWPITEASPQWLAGEWSRHKETGVLSAGHSAFNFFTFTYGGSLTVGSAVELYAGTIQAVLDVSFTPPVLALSSAATTTKLAAITQREVAVWKPFVVVIEATTGEDKANWPVLYQLSKDASNSLMVVQHPGGWIGVVYYNAGVGVSAYSSAVPDNTPFKLVLNVTATKIRAVLTVDSVQETVTLDIVRYGGVSILETVGSNWGGGQHWNGPIQSCTLIHPAVYIDAQLEAA